MIDFDRIFPRYEDYPSEIPIWCLTPATPRVIHRLRAHSLGSGMLNANNNWSVGTTERMKRLSGGRDFGIRPRKVGRIMSGG